MASEEPLQFLRQRRARVRNAEVGVATELQEREPTIRGFGDVLDDQSVGDSYPYSFGSGPGT